MKNPETIYSREPNGQRKLNVVFHGLWAWEALKTRILAHTPIEPEHEILVGDFEQQMAIPEGTECELIGVNPGGMNTFNVNQNLLVDNQPFDKEKAERHCVVDLPLPSDIRSVRRVPVKTAEPFEGKDGGKLHPKQVTMVQVFIYDVDHFDSVTLSKLDPSPSLRINAGGQTANLHFFAQPPTGHHHTEQAAKDAYKRMAAMFGLDIIPAEGLFTPPQDPAITGLTEQDMKFLGEPDSSTPAPHPHGRGFALPRPMFDPSGGNCDGLVLDNRYLAEGSGSSTSV